MRHYDENDAKELNAQPWQLDLLKLNPAYCHWGPHEDYMWKEGSGYVHTAPAAHVSLTLWWLHPRKGCSRGIEITNIEQGDLPAVFAFLRQAAERNAERFSKIPPAEAAA